MTEPSLIELRCSRELAILLGAFEPTSVEHHRTCRASGRFLMIRDPVTLVPLFWPLVPAVIDGALRRSS